MVATDSRTRVPSRSRIDVTPDEFERRLAAHGHRPDEIRRLWDELTEGRDEEGPAGRLLGLGPVIALYLGLLLVIVAAVSLLAIYWEELGAGGILGLAAAFFAGSLVASEILRRRLLPQPAGVLEAVSVAWAVLATYAIERLAGAWPSGASDIDHVHPAMTVLAFAGVATALTLLALRPDPLLVVPVALAVGVLAVDAAELVFGNDLSPRQRVTFLVPVGLAWLAGGLWLDVTRRRDFASAVDLVGLLTAGFAVVVLVPKTVPGFTVIGVLGAISLFISAFVRHLSYTVIGAVGVLMASTGAIGMLGGVAPLVIALVGLALIFVGLRWSRWRDTIRSKTLERMPESVRSFVGRLAPDADRREPEPIQGPS